MRFRHCGGSWLCGLSSVIRLSWTARIGWAMDSGRATTNLAGALPSPANHSLIRASESWLSTSQTGSFAELPLQWEWIKPLACAWSGSLWCVCWTGACAKDKSKLATMPKWSVPYTRSNCNVRRFDNQGNGFSLNHNIGSSASRYRSRELTR